MNLWLRLIKVLLMSFWRPRLGLLDASVLSFAVLPTDLDFNRHMTNARYLSLMDLGRLDLILRSGMWRLVLRGSLQPVIGGALVRFRHALRPFQPFRLTTRVLAWDARWLFIEHRVETLDGKPACTAVVRAAFVASTGMLPTADLLTRLGYGGAAPDVPAWIAPWLQADLACQPASPPLENPL
ncbi:thioesterase family protein [Rhodospirillum rubrum]|uniref:thioesterase family protein n=1 Tax=Rhodospirillum rubrum TaxID=1085 RepID=UPI0019064AF8|nr:thioesterase family protein [Rhodospirillum rubrum]